LKSTRLVTTLADEAAEVLRVRSRTKASYAVSREVTALKRFQKLMSKAAGKLTFANLDE
jgi:hypothetical protein